jgi:transposase
VLQPVRTLATGRRVGPTDGCDNSCLRRRYPDDRQHFYPRAPAGCDAKKGGRDHCLGRSRGGLTTKIHAVVDRQGLPLRLSLTTGQAHDAPAALTLLNRLEPRTIVLGDKAYDGNAIRELIESQGAVPNIPAKSNRKWKPCFSRTLYRERNSSASSSTSDASQPATTSSPTTSSQWSSSPQCDCGCALMSLRPR